VVNLGDCTVESDNLVAVISGVQDQVLAHDGQADEAEISSRSIVSDRSMRDVSTNVEVGKARAGQVEKSGQRDVREKLKVMKVSSTARISGVPHFVVARSRVAQPAGQGRAGQGNDDSDGGVIVIRKRSKTYVGPDMMRLDGRRRRKCVRDN